MEWNVTIILSLTSEMFMPVANKKQQLQEHLPVSICMVHTYLTLHSSFTEGMQFTSARSQPADCTDVHAGDYSTWERCDRKLVISSEHVGNHRLVHT